MICPYCHKKAVEVDRDEMQGYNSYTIDIVYQCTVCKKESVLRLEQDGWYDVDDNLINEDI